MTQVKLCPSFPVWATVGPYMAAFGPNPTTSRPTVPISQPPLQAKNAPKPENLGTLGFPGRGGKAWPRRQRESTQNSKQTPRQGAPLKFAAATKPARAPFGNSLDSPSAIRARKTTSLRYSVFRRHSQKQKWPPRPPHPI